MIEVFLHRFKRQDEAVPAYIIAKDIAKLAKIATYVQHAVNFI
jgi:hypothetical protein